MTDKRRIMGPWLPPVMFGYFFLITTAVYTVKPAKESLFLSVLGPERLPYAFLMTAVLMGLTVSINARLTKRLRRAKLLSLSLAFFALSGGLFWLIIRQDKPWPWIFLFIYCWGDLLMATSITQYWIFINDLFNPREAKRRLGFFVGGGLLGGIAGSMVARFWPAWLRTESLILVSAVILAVSILIVWLVDKFARRPSQEEAGGKSETPGERVGFAGSFSLVRKQPYLLLLSGMILATIVVSNLVHFQFQTVAKQSFSSTRSLTTFLATFYVIILAISYLFTTFLTSGLLKRFSLRAMLVIMPSLLFLGSAALFVPGINLLIWAVAIKGTDKTMTHSLMQSLRELLYIPVPPDIRIKAKVFIDMFLNKFADGLTGLLLLAVKVFFRLTLQETAFLIMAVIILWVTLCRRVAREYVNIVKGNLQIKWVDADRFVTESIDVDLTKLIFDTLQSRERSSVLYAMNLFDLIKKEKLSPELKGLISQKNAEIQAMSVDSALDAAGGGQALDFEDDLDPEDLSEQVREIMSLNVYEELMKTQLEKAAGETGGGAEVFKMEAAKMIGLMDASSPLAKSIDTFLTDPSAEVIRYAAESAGRLKLRSSVPRLIALLDRPATQEVAARALVAYGPSIAGTLRDYLADPQESVRVRRAIPDILARAGTQRSANILVMGLRGDSPEVEDEVIGSLHKMRRSDGTLKFPEADVLAKTVALLRKSHLILLQIGDLRQDKKKDTLVQELENSLARSMKRVFELLGLVYPQDDILKAYQNIQAGTKKALDYSIELLENILQKDIKELLLPLIEDIPLEEKVRHSRRLAKAAEKIRFT
jgi:ATP:ADP antiporter, AAA family